MNHDGNYWRNQFKWFLRRFLPAAVDIFVLADLEQELWHLSFKLETFQGIGVSGVRTGNSIYKYKFQIKLPRMFFFSPFFVDKDIIRNKTNCYLKRTFNFQLLILNKKNTSIADWDEHGFNIC